MPSLRKTPSQGRVYFAVAVADQETGPMGGEVEAEVARLLGDPGPGWVRGAAGKPDASAAVGDKEQGVVATQQHALDGEEITGDDARGLRS
jgi:hypothetical protein